ncbi:MAG: EFR1 family ferrodoxin [Oscillospiraceae bacterium]|jgi:ferredoxin|nr:EFR1 family ferrodoxin [Oscillospiraceae bacterium]
MSTIIYFSGTGNSYHIAKKISQHQNAKLISASDFEGTSISDDTIGIVTPVYCGGLPPIMYDFLKRVILRSRYIWAIAASGGTVGNAFETINDILQYNEGKLRFAEMILMPDNSILTRPKKEDTLSALENEERLVNEIIPYIDAKTENEYPVEKFLGKTSKVQWMSMKWVFRCNDKRVDKKTCTDCGICVDICPLENINSTNNKIKIGKNCTNCFACIHWCPTKSIRAGFIKAGDRFKYTHPDVNATELFKKKKAIKGV